jgi:UDP-glucose 4-epimerase
VGAERQVSEYARHEPNCVVTILRPCTILGPTIQSFWSKYFSRAVVPRIMGFDTLWQFVHEVDVIDAFLKVIYEDHPGAYNIVGDGVMALSTVLNLAGKISLPMPGPVLRATVDALWMAGQFDFPSSMLDYLRFMWIAEGNKAREKMGFHPRHSTREALESFLGMQRLRDIHLVD